MSSCPVSVTTSRLDYTVTQTKHSTDIGVWSVFWVNAHTEAVRRRRRFYVGRVLVLKPSLRFDYPLNSPNTASRPIREVGKRWTVH